ncbi:MAG: EamA family transporter [Gammaproteobacteria bacterium]
MTKFLPLIMHAFLLAAILSSSHSVLKWVSVQANNNYWELLLAQWKYIFLALSLYGLVFFYYIFVLRSSPISTLYPIYTGLSVLFVMLLGYLVFGEVVTLSRTIGALLILAGIVVMGWSYP